MAQIKADLEQRDIDEIAFLRENPAYAVYHLFGTLPPWWQREWIENAFKIPNCMIIGSRGSGKSFTLAEIGLIRAVLFSDEKIGIISNSYRQSQIVFREMARAIDRSVFLQKSVTKGPTFSPTVSYLEFSNGSRIEAQPLGDGSKIVGSRYFMILVDEFTKIPQEILDVVVLPMMQVNKNPVSGLFLKDEDTVTFADSKSDNRIVFTGTAGFKASDCYKKFGLFEKECLVHPEKYYLNSITIDDVRSMNGFLNEEAVRLELESMSSVKFLMENYAFWVDGTDGFFSAEHCEAMRDVSVSFLREGNPDKEYVMGIDTAKSDDNFAIVIMEMGFPDKIVNVFATNEKEQSTGDTLDYVRELNRKFNIIKINMDSRGGGTWAADDLAKKYTYVDKEGNIVTHEGLGNKMELIAFNHPLIDEMNWKLKSDIENRKIKVPAQASEGESVSLADFDIAHKNHQEIEATIDELEAIVTDVVQGGQRFRTATKTQKKDRYSALLIANWGIRQIEESRNEELYAADSYFLL